jgi:rubredoxin
MKRPPSLREVLDAGCDLPSTGVWLDGLAEDLFTTLPFYPPNERARRAVQYRACVESMVLHGEDSDYMPVSSDGSRGPKTRGMQEYISLELWRAEAYEDEDLAVRLREALPDEIKAKHQPNCDRARRPFPLVLRVPEQWWQCQNCGATFDGDQGQEAVVVTCREGFSDLDDELEYCFDCIRMVAEATRIEVA